MKTRVTYVISDINKALAFEWVNEYLDRDKFDLSFILLNTGESALEHYLREKKAKVYRVTYNGKKDFFKAFFRLRKILKKEKTQVIHTHLFTAALLGLLAGKSLGIRKRINTRHHSTFHHVYFPRAVYYDKFINFLATDIIAISENVKQVLTNKENVKPQKITLIHHGFKLDNFDTKHVEKNRVADLSKKYGTEGKFPVLGVIARYSIWKGIQFVVPAFAKILEKYPTAHLLLANARGDYKDEIQKHLSKLPQDSFTEITFENDLFALYQLFDVYVHTPIDEHSEAFGQTYIEALAAGVPSVFTLSGVASEFVEHEKNAIVVPFQDSKAILKAVLRLLEDEKLGEGIVGQGKADSQKFRLEYMIDALEKLYLK